MIDRYPRPDPTLPPNMYALVPCERCDRLGDLQLSTGIYKCRTCPDGGRPAPLEMNDDPR